MSIKASAITLTAVAVSFLASPVLAETEDPGTLTLSRSDYARRLEGFWLGQSIANWTGLVTEMDKIGGEGVHGEFYTRDDWGKADQPSIWSEGVPSDLSPTIDWVFAQDDGAWGADDDTDIEYMYQHLLLEYQTSVLSPEQIRDGWLRYIYSDENTPFTNNRGEPENYLWVSNQQAHDLMREHGLLPPATSDPRLNPHHDMIDAQLTTEIFGLFAPGRPDIALRLAHLPIRTTARGDAALAAEFYIVMHSLAATADPAKTISEQVKELRKQARALLPEQSYTAKMYDFVEASHNSGLSWEDTRDALYQRYQVEQADGYDVSSRELFCNGCFASGINFGASIISLFYGDGDYQETVKIAVLAGWDSDNPAATWGGLLGFLLGRDGIEDSFGRTFTSKFHIHRTRGGFPNDGLDDFPAMAQRGLGVIDRVIAEEIDGVVDAENENWQIPLSPTAH